jgi:hypothetical protein
MFIEISEERVASIFSVVQMRLEGSTFPRIVSKHVRLHGVTFEKTVVFNGCFGEGLAER